MSRLITNTREFATLSNRLDRMHRSTLPVVVRSTLNSLAYKMNKEDLQISSKRAFTYQRSNIVRNLTWTRKANGFNVKTMRATTGIRERPNRQNVARGLAAQERGGKINSRIVPTKNVRGGSISSKVKASKRIGNRTIIDARLKRRGKFIAAASVANKQKALLLVKFRNGGAGYAEVTNFRRKKKGNPNIKLRWNYRLLAENKKVAPGNSKRFVKNAYISTMKNLGPEFRRQAQRKLRL